MSGNELFVLTDDLSKSVWDSGPDVVSSLVSEMHSFGIFKFPYEVIDLRVVSCRDGHVRLWIKDFRLADKIEHPQLMFSPGFSTRAFTSGVLLVDDGLLDEWTTPQDRQTMAAGLLDVTAVSLVLALATANTQKKVVSNKRAKLGIGKSINKNYPRITYLSLPRTGAGTHTRTGARGHVRLHLRRGHSRHQHFGKANEQIKRIWIAPVFVNAADGDYTPRTEYRVRREYA